MLKTTYMDFIFTFSTLKEDVVDFNFMENFFELCWIEGTKTLFEDETL